LAAVALTVPQWQVVYQHVDPKQGDVVGLDIATSVAPTPRALTRRPTGAHDWDNGPAWSPDGKLVAFARFYAHAGLYVVAASGGTARLLAHGSVTDLAWSPDGA